MKIRCSICPKQCELGPGETGDCRVRRNDEGRIRCVTYGRPCSLNIDPIEKKPLYHVLPGTSVLSIGTAGCNLHCRQCQNARISQELHLSDRSFSPHDAVLLAQKENCPAIAYTYAEPLVSYEYTLDCCKAAAEAGLKNILVTAAYINPDPLRKICRYVDAANVDLKAFSDSFYRTICAARLQPVLEALTILHECGVMIEITNLVIPTLNDDSTAIRALCDWIRTNLGEETPLHFSRFYPQYRLQHLPPTPVESILAARRIAIESGLKFVYVGNMHDRAGESTFCPGCGSLLVKRHGYRIEMNQIEQGRCPDCHGKIYGIWG